MFLSNRSGKDRLCCLDLTSQALNSGAGLQEAGQSSVERTEAAAGKCVSRFWPVATETVLGASKSSPGALVVVSQAKY